ncbi:MAG: polysaccharide deacetylase family protein [Bacteroidetes bacterium]|nr:polysaccharide deacetylase family protein [Bacteroidota bacterium]
MYLRQTPPLIKALASQLTWSGPAYVNGEPAVYLTFDDGPHPVITRQVLRMLEEYEVKATFFCVGSNVLKYPDVVAELKSMGHLIGNHTFAHESGWSASNAEYFRSYLKCQQLVNEPLFRPPYGRISRSQAEAIGKRTEIVMWDVLSADFDLKKTPEDCLNQLIINTRPGAIVVFHDSERAAPRMLPILQPYLEWLRAEGYSCHLLPKR